MRREQSSVLRLTRRGKTKSSTGKQSFITECLVWKKAGYALAL